MKRLLVELWHDESGAATAMSVILIYTILGLGVITGLVCLRNQISFEFGDLAVALDSLDQSYHVEDPCGGVHEFLDTPSLTDPDGGPPAGLTLGDRNDPAGPPLPVNISGEGAPGSDVPAPTVNNAGEEQ